MAPAVTLQAWDAAIAKASTISQAKIAISVQNLRAKHPRANPAELIQLLNRRFLRFSQLTGAGVGVAAAFPTVGTVAAVGLTGAQLASFVTATAWHVLSVAEIHGIGSAQIPRRRTLLLTALLGEEAAIAAQESLGLSSLQWAHQIMTRLPNPTVTAVNEALRNRIAKRFAQKGMTIAFGRLIPFGIGAGVGWFGGRTMAKSVLESTAAAFGPAPERFPIEPHLQSKLTMY